MPNLNDSVGILKGVGERREKAFLRNGIATVEDLLCFFPKDYRSGVIYPVSSQRCGQFSGFSLTVESAPGVVSMPGGRRFLRYLAKDEAGHPVHILHMNQPYLKRTIFKGDHFFYFGVLQEKNGKFYLFSPERMKTPPDPDKLRPVYPTLSGIPSKLTEKLVAQCLVSSLPAIRETLPEFLLSHFKLMGRARAIFSLHAPASEEVLKQAKRRFLFEELFSFRVRSLIFSNHIKTCLVPGFQNCNPEDFLTTLPFSPTAAQRRVIREIQKDLESDTLIHPMNRLIQGDVGCGKTVVAATAAYFAVQNKKSCLVMAPTEILANQHFAAFSKLFSPLGVPVFLLTGSTPKGKREKIFQETTKDLPYILIGTHALTEESAKCRNVSLAITDEQHRFGVRHRNLLGEKGGAVHSLVMSATPIPRSLAMFLFSEGNISLIDQLPPGRQVVDTLYVGEDKMPRIYSFLQERIREGQQVYIVCPLIENEEGESPLHSAAQEFSQVQKALPGVSVSLLHGRMKSEEKSRVMADFERGEIQVLVSTTVIEVGVDVPNATVMVIRSAERFGLSQLHQLRGRVGRGKEKSYCILVSSHSGKNARERLKKLCDCHDGMEIAKFDLENRGPGEFFGTRQTGFSSLPSFDRFSMDLVQEAARAAEYFLEKATEEELAPYAQKTRLN